MSDHLGIEIQVKNMVCPRCIMAVEQTLQQLDISFDKVLLGKIFLSNPIEGHEMSLLETAFKKHTGMTPSEYKKMKKTGQEGWL